MFEAQTHPVAGTVDAIVISAGESGLAMSRAGDSERPLLGDIGAIAKAHILSPSRENPALYR